MGAAYETLHEIPGRSARLSQMSRLLLHPGRTKEALRAARLPQHFHREHRDTSWRLVKLETYSRCLTQ